MNAQALPNAVPAERALLGALLTEPSGLLQIGDLVAPGDFYHLGHGRLFELLQGMAARGEAIDLVTVSERILRGGQADRFGGAGYIADLPEHAPSTVNVRHYAEIVREKATLRRVIQAARDVEREALDLSPSAEPGEAEQLAQRAAQALASTSTPSHRSTWTAVETVDLTEAEAEEAATSGRGSQVWPSGFAELDVKLAGGFRPGDLVVIGGSTSQGKSALAMSLAVNASLVGGAVGYASVEPRRGEWSQRLLSCASGVPLQSVRSWPDRTQGDHDQLVAWRDEIATWPMRLYYRPGASLLDVATQARRWKLEAAGLDMLVVDYLQLMRHDRRDRHDLAIGATVSGLKHLAGELEMVVVLLSQITRSSQKGSAESGKGRSVDASTGWWEAARIPTLVDLKESGSIENDADVVLFPMRAEKAGPGGEPLADAPSDAALIRLAKQRNGPTGIVSAVWDGPCACYRPEVDRGLL